MWSGAAACIPNINGRTRAIRDLLMQAPLAVVARMLGYHPNTAETFAAQAGTTWKRYAASRHDMLCQPRLNE